MGRASGPMGRRLTRFLLKHAHRTGTKGRSPIRPEERLQLDARGHRSGLAARADRPRPLLTQPAGKAGRPPAYLDCRHAQTCSRLLCASPLPVLKDDVIKGCLATGDGPLPLQELAETTTPSGSYRLVVPQDDF